MLFRSPGLMHDTGCLGLVHWDHPEGWYGEGGGFRTESARSFGELGNPVSEGTTRRGTDTPVHPTRQVPPRGTPRVPAPLPLSPFSPPDGDRRGDSPAWSGPLLPPPSPYHPSGWSQCTSPKHPVSCIKPGLETHFILGLQQETLICFDF